MTTLIQRLQVISLAFWSFLGEKGFSFSQNSTSTAAMAPSWITTWNIS